MADQLKVSTSELRKTSNQFAQQREKMMGACTQVAGIARGTSEYWRGTASEAFAGKFSAMYTELQQTDRRMQDAVDGLLKTAGIFEESEKQTTGNARALDTGLSPFL